MKGTSPLEAIIAATSQAFGRLELHPRWAEVQQRTLEAQPTPPFTSLEEGLDAGLDFFRHVAGAHLDLVSNSQSADDVCVVFSLVGQAAYGHAGLPLPERIAQPGAQISGFQARITELERQFKMKAYELARRCPERERARERAAWLDRKLAGRADAYIQKMRGPDHKTIQVYRSGAITRKTPSVRAGLAKVFGCGLSEVPR